MAGNTKAHCIHTSFPFILLECLDAKKSTEFTNEQMRLSPIKKKKSTLPALCLPAALTVCQTQQVLTPLYSLGPSILECFSNIIPVTLGST